MQTKQRIAIFYHLFYEDTYELVEEELKPLRSFDSIFIFNICDETPDKQIIRRFLKTHFPECYIIESSNKGKDIGAKLAMLHLYEQLEIEVDYFLFLHDKKSLQALKGTRWKTDLLKIVASGNLDRIFDLFAADSKIGIIATKEYVINEPVDQHKFTDSNSAILHQLLDKYPVKPSSFAFVAGTMFWARAKPFREFFKKHHPLEIRKQLENGNVIDNFSGTITHSWERILTWTLTSRGFSIKGI